MSTTPLTWTVGAVTITRVVEVQAAGGTRSFWPQATPEAITAMGWLIPDFADERGRLILNAQTMLVESEGIKIIVDTCYGNDKERDLPLGHMLDTDYLERLSASGFAPDDVDIVLCTHMHGDHVGWHTRLVDDRWVPTFPNARYLAARAEYDHWVHGEGTMRFGDVVGDSIAPVVEAGLMDLVDKNHRITSEVVLEPTPGHTAHHVSVRISSQGHDALITGDCIHHPFQIARPEWPSPIDDDPEQAIATRTRLLADHCDTDTLFIGTHWASPTAGYLVSDGDRYRLDPLHQPGAEDDRHYRRW